MGEAAFRDTPKTLPRRGTVRTASGPAARVVGPDCSKAAGLRGDGCGSMVSAVIQMAELPGVAVEVTRVVYLPGKSGDPASPHAFAYFITVRNQSPTAVVLRGRKWVVRSDGGVLVVEGDGVVGQTPRIAPGDSFSYNSYHTVATDSVAEGAFFFQTDSGGGTGYAKIPPFAMRVPRMG